MARIAGQKASDTSPEDLARAFRDEDSPAALKRGIEAELWSRGSLTYLLRPGGQKTIADFVSEWIDSHPDDLGPVVVTGHRRIGKSTLIVNRGFARCLQKPGLHIRAGAPTLKDLVEYILPIIRTTLAHCPKELRPRRSGNTWTFRNPRWGDPDAVSCFYLFSCQDDAENQRGKATDELSLDECRNIENLEYIVNDIFGWQFAGRAEATGEQPVFIMYSTPPRWSIHPYKKIYVDQANLEDRHILLPTTADPDWTERDDRMLAKLIGGKDTLAWKREALCEFVDDEAVLILPEFRTYEAQIVRQVPRPRFFVPYIFLDGGWVDWMACLFAYLDFEKQLLVVEDEIFVRRTTTGELADRMLLKAQELWGKTPEITPRGIADLTQLELHGFKRELNDLYRKSGRMLISMRAAEKTDQAAWVAALRTSLQRGRVVILPRCKKLIYQCRNGVRDEKGDFLRQEEDLDLGHVDGVAALQYGHRQVNFSENPDTTRMTIRRDEYYSPPAAPEPDERSPGLKITHRPLHITRKPLK